MRVFPILAMTVLFGTVMAAVFLGTKFRLSLRREAPDLFAAYYVSGSPSVRAKMILPYAMLIYFRRYRRELAGYPVSRAWASWIFANTWVQLLAALAIIAATLR
ncbi:MAG TPA: hypothetical protein VKR38_06305 [Usitatibacter sp.]|nr:hypothetical protein [Usitatibacter sp.]